MPMDAAFASRQHTVDQLIPEPLVMALTMVVDDKSFDRPSKVALAEGNHSVETLLLDRAHEAFGVRNRVSHRLHRQRAVRPKRFKSRTHSIRYEAAFFN